MSSSSIINVFTKSSLIDVNSELNELIEILEHEGLNVENFKTDLDQIRLNLKMLVLIC